MERYWHRMETFFIAKIFVTHTWCWINYNENVFFYNLCVRFLCLFVYFTHTNIFILIIITIIIIKHSIRLRCSSRFELITCLLIMYIKSVYFFINIMCSICFLKQNSELWTEKDRDLKKTTRCFIFT